jgi:hypothetical protein
VPELLGQRLVEPVVPPHLVAHHRIADVDAVVRVVERRHRVARHGPRHREHDDDHGHHRQGIEPDGTECRSEIPPSHRGASCHRAAAAKEWQGSAAGYQGRSRGR